MQPEPIPAPTREGDPGGGRALLGASAVLLLTLTLRVPTTSVSPLVSTIGADTGFSPTTLALLTTVPLVCFVAVAPAVPALLARLGLRALLLGSLLGATVGTLVRSAPAPAALAAGTLLLGCAVAVASVLAPAVVRDAVPSARGRLTALYTAGLSIGPALATGLTVPVGDLLGGGWRTALALWAVLPLLAAVSWELARPRAGDGAASRGRDLAPVGARLRDVARDRGAWRVTGYLGLTSLLFYTTTAWLPTVLEDGGASPVAAGATTALAGVAAVPASFLAPLVARAPARARLLVPLAPLPVACGLALLLAAPGAAGTAAVLLGLGQGASVGVAYTLVVSAARSAGHAAALSSLSQTVGVTLAASGPVAVAAVHEATGGWTAALGLLAGVAVVQAVVVGGGVARSLRVTSALR